MGCVGWSYDDWVGPFYPEGSQPKDYLPFYSRVFDAVEIDSTFYSLPNAWLVGRWRDVTPEGFAFTVKLPQQITHEKKLRECEEDLTKFYSVLKGLRPKLKCVLAQMPPSFNYRDDYRALSSFIERWIEEAELTSGDLKLAIELRNESFFRDETYELLTENNICFVWSVNQYTRDFPVEVTSSFLYLRFIGDRRLTKFDRIQIDRTAELRECWERLSKEMGSVEQAFVFSNNHFAGYVPGTIEQFRKMALA